MFDKLKKSLGLGAKETPASPPPAKPFFEFGALKWIPAEKTWFKLDVLDMRPFTQTMISWSKDSAYAANAISYGARDGREFTKQSIAHPRTTSCELRYRCDPTFTNGRLFQPREMEDKWAIFHFDGLLYFIRSWRAELEILARVRHEGNELIVTEITEPSEGPQDVVTWESADPTIAARRVDFLLKALAMHNTVPCPLPSGIPRDPETITMYCWAAYGRSASSAAFADTVPIKVETVLRSSGELEMAIQRADNPSALAFLNSGAPTDTRSTHDGITPMHAAAALHNIPIIQALLARGADLFARSDSGQAPLHYAVARAGEDLTHIQVLLDHGADINAQSGEGTTPLQAAVQNRNVAAVKLLLDRKADPNLHSTAGFVPLHTAAEMGQLEVVKLLLAAGARKDIVAKDHTPKSLAELRGHADIAKLL